MGVQINKAIVIGTYHGREDWLADCLQSLAGYETYPVISVAIPWELNVIKWCYQWTNLDEFLFLQDTVVLKDLRWLDYVMGDSSGDVSLCHKLYFMYLGKYRRQTINAMYAPVWPVVNNKRDAVTYEGEWTNRYVEAGEVVTSLWDLDDTEHYVERHGRLNKVIENDHIIKYKGTWSPEMIPA